MIKGIIYDLDGTIISTTKFHETAWIETGKKFNVNISQDFLISQKGMTNEAATRMIIPNDEESLKSFVKAKEEYVIKNAGKVEVLEGFEETCKYLLNKDINSWICTSAPKEFVEKVYKKTPLFSLFENKTVWREMYNNGKPHPEPLILTLNKMNLLPTEAVYVGDAYNDYLSATAAGCKFVYYLSDDSFKDVKIPNDILTINNHFEIIGLLGI